MEPNERDKSVRNEIPALLADERLILRETQRAVTPFGGVAVFLAYLGKIDLAGKVREYMPVQWRSPNQIDPAATFISFLISDQSVCGESPHTRNRSGEGANRARQPHEVAEVRADHRKTLAVSRVASAAESPATASAELRPKRRPFVDRT